MSLNKNNYYTFFIFIMAMIVFFQSCKKDKPIVVEEELVVYFKKEGSLDLINNEEVIKSFGLEFASTKEEREQGLMWRNEMADNQAMLFIHPDEEIGALSYWMKNTRIPLDIVYISPDSIVTNIAKNARPHQQLGVPTASENAKFVLEINGGLSDEIGIVPGKTKVRWKKD